MSELVSNTEHITNPVAVVLQGGILDGDRFELIPNGSIAPPFRLSYAYRDTFPDGSGGFDEFACWLNYEATEGVPEWTDQAIVYRYAGKEKMALDR